MSAGSVLEPDTCGREDAVLLSDANRISGRMALPIGVDSSFRRSIEMYAECVEDTGEERIFCKELMMLRMGA